ncbi:MAG: hypothetical protein ACJAWL_001035 [Motiliproteus sp.]|jgi:hypothetical protein
MAQSLLDIERQAKRRSNAGNCFCVSKKGDSVAESDLSVLLVAISRAELPCYAMVSANAIDHDTLNAVAAISTSNTD